MKQSITKRSKMIELYKQKYNEEQIENEYGVFLYGRNKAGLPVLCGWFSISKSIKPEIHYSFKDENQRRDYYLKIIEKAKSELSERAKRMQEYKIESDKIQPGVFLVCTWGYEQTNQDFYKVIERKGDFVKIQEVEKELTRGTEYMSGYVKPKDIPKGEILRRKISYGGINISSYKYARLVDRDEYLATWYA